jgi:hypothetical protein
MRGDKLGREGGEQMKGGKKGRGMKRNCNNIHINVRTHLCTTGPTYAMFLSKY